MQNIRGTNTCHPRGRARHYGTWKKFYVGDDEREWPRTCRIRECGEPAHGGAHVHVDGEEGVFIVPMCQEHNTPQEDDWLPVKPRTVVVRVKDGDTSGPQGICYCKKWWNLVSSKQCSYSCYIFLATLKAWCLNQVYSLNVQHFC